MLGFLRDINHSAQYYFLLVIAHTPKRDSGFPLTQYDLAGSSKLMNFFDSGIVIGLSSRDKNLRYVKQVKYRAGEKEYDYDNVILYEIVKEHAYMHFAYRGHGVEADHIKAPSFSEDLDEIQQILDLQANGKSVREIAAETGFAPTTVHRKIKKALELGYKPSCSVPFHSGAEQAEQLNN